MLTVDQKRETRPDYAHTFVLCATRLPSFLLLLCFYLHPRYLPSPRPLIRHLMYAFPAVRPYFDA